MLGRFKKNRSEWPGRIEVGEKLHWIADFHQPQWNKPFPRPWALFRFPFLFSFFYSSAGRGDGLPY